MGLKLITAATGSPVTLAEAKADIGIESSDWDSKLQLDIAAATAMVEEWTGRSLGEQTWQLTLDAFADEIELPKGPVTAVSFVKYRDAERDEQTLSVGAYITDLVSDPQRLVRDPEASWPETAEIPNAVIVQFVTGYSSAPALLKKAVLFTVAAWFRDRETGQLPAGVMTLLEPYRSQWIFA